MATGIPNILEGDGVVRGVSEEDKSGNCGRSNQRSDTNTNFSIIDESLLVHEGKFSACDVEALEGFSSDNDYDLSDEEEDIFCDDYGFLAEEDLAYEESER
ncbi:unnamed protein product, partial [Cylicocyclus nassatus]